MRKQREMPSPRVRARHRLEVHLPATTVAERNKGKKCPKRKKKMDNIK